MLISRTPYRFSLYGGGLDYPEWYSKNTTRVLCAGLDVTVIKPLENPFFSHRFRIAYSKVETVDEINAIEHPAVREVVRAYGNNRSLEISHVGDLPSKSGIGSSSAFSVGLINSLSALNGKFMGRSALANASVLLEQGAMGERVGFQDQCAAAFGGIYIEANQQSIHESLSLDLIILITLRITCSRVSMVLSVSLLWHRHKFLVKFLTALMNKF